METEQKKRGIMEFLVAAATFVAVVALGLTGIGLVFVPFICLFGDGRSRTPMGLVGLGVLCVGSFVFWGVEGVLPAAFAVVSTMVPYICWKKGIPTRQGAAVSLLAGVLAGMIVIAGIGYLTQRDPGGALGKAMEQTYLQAEEDSPERVQMDSSLMMLEIINSGFELDGEAAIAAVEAMPIAERAMTYGEFWASLDVYFPAMAMALGLLTGLLSFYPSLRLLKLGGSDIKQDVPALGRVYIPRYVVFAILGVTVVCWAMVRFGADMSPGIYYAAFVALFAVLMMQGIFLMAFMLGKTRMHKVWQVVIVLAACMIFSLVCIWLGMFETIFNLRLGISRMDYLRRRGVAPNTSEAQQLIRKHDEELGIDIPEEKKNEEDDER